MTAQPLLSSNAGIINTDNPNQQIIIGGDGMRRLLERMHKRHLAYAAMNSESSKISSTRARTLAIIVITIGAVSTISADTVKQLSDTEWTVLFMQISTGIMVALTAVEALLDFAKRGVKFRDAKASHMRAADLIDIALACDDDSNDTVHYDYTSVLEEVQNIHDGLKKSSLEILRSVADKYPEYEAPWLSSSTTH
jgi:hypothetical protein